MVPKGGLEPPRVTSHAPQTCASASSATSARRGHYSDSCINDEIYCFVAAGEAAGAADAAGDAAGCCVGSGVGVAVAVGALSGAVSKTDRWPLSEGSASINAISINTPAAPIVIFASRLAVPRGPKAVLESELENNAPASAFPGCKRMTTINTTQASTKRLYKIIVTKI